MEKNFEKFLSMLAHGSNPFVVYNDENSYGEKTICVAVSSSPEYGQDLQKTLITYKFFSTQDEDTGLNVIKYEGCYTESNEGYNTLTYLTKGLEGIEDDE